MPELDPTDISYIPQPVPLPTHHRFVDMTGKRFGKLVVQFFAGVIFGRPCAWCVKCDCGTVKVIPGYSMTRKREPSISCGCVSLAWARSGDSTRSHGKSDSPEYGIWEAIRRRCRDKGECWPYYGAKGIKVCERWMKFANFYADMGPRPSSKHSIERRDGNKDYCPENCEWATWDVQCRNTSQNHWLTYGEETLCLRDWARRFGVTDAAINHHLRKGKTFDWIAPYLIGNRDKRLLKLAQAIFSAPRG